MSVLFMLLLVSSDPITAQQSAPAPDISAAQPAQKKAREKRICKTNDDNSGTRMSQRVCRTESEWRQESLLGSSRSGLSVSGDVH
jgi:hypothetical protein